MPGERQGRRRARRAARGTGRGRRRSGSASPRLRGPSRVWSPSRTAHEQVGTGSAATTSRSTRPRRAARSAGRPSRSAAASSRVCCAASAAAATGGAGVRAAPAPPQQAGLSHPPAPCAQRSSTTCSRGDLGAGRREAQARRPRPACQVPSASHTTTFTGSALMTAQSQAHPQRRHPPTRPAARERAEPQEFAGHRCRVARRAGSAPQQGGQRADVGEVRPDVDPEQHRPARARAGAATAGSSTSVAGRLLTRLASTGGEPAAASSAGNEPCGSSAPRGRRARARRRADHDPERPARTRGTAGWPSAGAGRPRRRRSPGGQHDRAGRRRPRRVDAQRLGDARNRPGSAPSTVSARTGPGWRRRARAGAAARGPPRRRPEHQVLDATADHHGSAISAANAAKLSPLAANASRLVRFETGSSSEASWPGGCRRRRAAAAARRRAAVANTTGVSSTTVASRLSAAVTTAATAKTGGAAAPASRR